jgi:hypothetical protein
MKRSIIAAGAIVWLTQLGAAGSAVGPFPSQTGFDSVRISGEILVEGGGPLAGATIRTDALRGAVAAQFSGPRDFTATTGKRGEWSLLGVTRGLWILEVTAPDHLPHVVVVPISMMTKPEPRPWETSLALLPSSALATTEAGSPAKVVIEAAGQAQTGDKGSARQALQTLSESGLDATALCAAGDVALLVREAGLAKRFFERAIKDNATWYRPQLGIASAAMMTFDTDVAVKAYAAARSNTKNSKLQQMLSAAIRDLQQIR